MEKDKFYREIDKAFSVILTQAIPWEAALVSLIALIKQHLPYVSWVGLYRLVDETLWIGPYQGKVACPQIPAGRGVCGWAVAHKRPLIVPNVDEFPNHIVCDPLSRSEFVIPVERKRKILGVLDLDSREEKAFDDVDLKRISEFLSRLEELPL